MENHAGWRLRCADYLFLLLVGYFLLLCPLIARAQTGSISGTVFEADGVTPIEGIVLDAYSEKCELPSVFNILDAATTNSDGEYTLSDLPEGEVYIRANQWTPTRPPGPYSDEPDYNLDYEGEWYGDQIRCDAAVPVTVTAGQNTSGVNFQLNDAGSVSGVVYEDDGITPIETIYVYATSSPCAEFVDIIGNAYTDDSGAYVVDGLHEGEVYIRITNGGKNYVGEFFDNVTDCNEADAVTVISGESTADIDFQLDEGGIISGNVYSNFEGCVNGLVLYAYSEKCGEMPVGSAVTNANGWYEIPGLPPGDIYLLASEDWALDSHYYAEEWHDDAHSCDEADPVALSAGEEIEDINFFLYPRTDDDNDTMPDDWETEIFGDTSRDGSDDYDGDGISDLDEYLAGTDPTAYDADTGEGAGDPDASDSTIDDENTNAGTDEQDGTNGGGGGCFITTVID